MQSTLFRQLMILRELPRQPQSITVSQLAIRLRDRHQIVIHRRSLERDLQQLSTPFAIVPTEGKPAGWSWHADAKPLDIPGLDPNTALTFSLVGDYLKDVLPSSTVEDLKPYMDTAAAVLKQSRSGFAKWRDKVRVIGRGLALRPPEIDRTVQRTVYSALFDGKRLAITYAVKGERSRKTYDDVNPVAIVVRQNIVYLLCTMWDYTDVRQLLLHRMKSAAQIPRPAKPLRDFNLDAYIAGGNFGYSLGPAMRLEALFDKAAAAHLEETPLSDDQTLHAAGADKVRVRATVADNQELRWWLLAFGAQVEVIRPPALRDEFAHEARAMARRYGRS